MDYREEPSYRINIFNNEHHDSRGCMCDSDADQSQIDLHCKETSDTIKEKKESEHDDPK